MKRIPTLTLACLLALAGHVQAQARNDDHSAHHLVAGAATTAAADMTEGEVRKVDLAANKITLKHGAIKNLDMPPMSMVFQARDPALLKKVKAGDKVRFTAAEINGVLTLMSIEKAK
jgi:Cu(I)/Ag(I) efflux system periplasmic protein CusF